MGVSPIQERAFWDIHSGLPQEGPGSEKSTLRALSSVGRLPDKPDILDVGCGPGRQTMILAANTTGRITAVDTHQPFLDEVEDRAMERGIAGRVRTVNSPMSELGLPDQSFDLIWSEGAVYLMGFREGLTSWKRLLRPSGAIAVSEVTWLRDSPPKELVEFGNGCYPAITGVEENKKTIAEAGYTLVTSFALPDSDWWEYYRPIEDRLTVLEAKYAGNKEAMSVLQAERFEMDLFRKYSSFYGYVFYVMRLA